MRARLIRWFFAAAFGAGFVVHLVLGRTDPESYGAFGETAWAPLAWLWEAWVMPNIGWLTVLTALYELAIAAGLLAGGQLARLAAAGASLFFVFLLFLGYGMPQPTLVGHFLANQLLTLAFLVAMVPVLWSRPRGRAHDPSAPARVTGPMG